MFLFFLNFGKTQEYHCQIIVACAAVFDFVSSNILQRFKKNMFCINCALVIAPWLLSHCDVSDPFDDSIKNDWLSGRTYYVVISNEWIQCRIVPMRQMPELFGLLICFRICNHNFPFLESVSFADDISFVIFHHVYIRMNNQTVFIVHRFIQTNRVPAIYRVPSALPIYINRYRRIKNNFTVKVFVQTV